MSYISEFFWNITRIFLDYLQIILNFLYVCQSFSWLTFLLKLGQYRYISCTGRDIFLKIFGGFPGINLQLIQVILNFLYVCQSFSWLTSLLKLYKYRDISSSEWDVFLIFFGYIPWIFLEYFQINPNFFYVCQSFSQLTSLLK